MQTLIDELNKICGEDHVTTDRLECDFYAQDVFTRAIPAAIVAAPGDKHQLAAVMKASTDAGFAIVPRGGGMSYTSGYVPSLKNTTLIYTSSTDTYIS